MNAATDLVTRRPFDCAFASRLASDISIHMLHLLQSQSSSAWPTKEDFKCHRTQRCVCRAVQGPGEGEHARQQDSIRVGPDDLGGVLPSGAACMVQLQHVPCVRSAPASVLEAHVWLNPSPNYSCTLLFACHWNAPLGVRALCAGARDMRTPASQPQCADLRRPL